MSDDTPVIGRNKRLFDFNHGGKILDFWQTDQNAENTANGNTDNRWEGSQVFDPGGMDQINTNISDGYVNHSDDMTPHTKEQKIDDPPTASDANLGGLSLSVSDQQRRRNASSVLTSGAGLLDEPLTASRTLLGN